MALERAAAELVAQLDLVQDVLLVLQQQRQLRRAPPQQRRVLARPRRAPPRPLLEHRPLPEDRPRQQRHVRRVELPLEDLHLPLDDRKHLRGGVAGAEGADAVVKLHGDDARAEAVDELGGARVEEADVLHALAVVVQ